MKQIFHALVLAVAILAMASLSWAGKITGNLVDIDGEYYIVMDQNGNEHEIHFDKTTKQDGEVKKGVRVEVDEENGHAKSIKVVKTETQKK